MAEGEYHLVVLVWIKTPDGRFVISRRHPDKKPFPGMWEASGGCVLAGEDSRAGAAREVEEELGLAVEPSSGRLVFQWAEAEHRHCLDVWVFERPVDPAEIRCQPSEVAEARLASLAEIEVLLATGDFVPGCARYLALL